MPPSRDPYDNYGIELTTGNSLRFFEALESTVPLSNNSVCIRFEKSGNFMHFSIHQNKNIVNSLFHYSYLRDPYSGQPKKYEHHQINKFRQSCEKLMELDFLHADPRSSYRPYSKYGGLTIHSKAYETFFKNCLKYRAYNRAVVPIKEGISPKKLIFPEIKENAE